MAAKQVLTPLLRPVRLAGGVYRSVSAAPTISSGDRKLEGKVAVVTGSTEGIGLSMARRLGLDGASVMICSRKQDSVDKALTQLTLDGVTVHGMTCDVGSRSDRERLVEKTLKIYGGIDIFVGNAAANSSKTKGLMSCTDKTWDLVFEINLKANFHLTKLIAPHMKRRQGGVIVFVGSSAAYFTPWELGSYTVSKTALVSLCKVFSQELVKDNIRVNCLAPGLIRTKFAKNLLASEIIGETVKSLIPMKRVSEADEYDGAISFLCGPESAYMTGETLRIDGGVMCRL